MEILSEDIKAQTTKIRTSPCLFCEKTHELEVPNARSTEDACWNEDEVAAGGPFDDDPSYDDKGYDVP